MTSGIRFQVIKPDRFECFSSSLRSEVSLSLLLPPSPQAQPNELNIGTAMEDGSAKPTSQEPFKPASTDSSLDNI